MIFGAAILEEKVPVDVGDEVRSGIGQDQSRDLKYLKDSFVYVHKAIQTINEKNLVEPVKSPFGEGTVTRLGLATSVAWPWFRPLRTDGGIPAHERDCAAGQPVD